MYVAVKRHNEWRGTESVQPTKQFVRVCRLHELILVECDKAWGKEILRCSSGCKILVSAKKGRSDLSLDTIPFDVKELVGVK